MEKSKMTPTRLCASTGQVAQASSLCASTSQVAQASSLCASINQVAQASSLCTATRRYLLCLLSLFCAFIASSQPQVIENTLRDNWFVQAGLDMSLQCPYQKDFREVFPKGKSFGVDIAAGRWFSPEIGVRLHLNWENGIKLLRNGHLEWLSPSQDGKSNMDCGGYYLVSCDVPVSVSNIVAGYDPARRWNALVYARMGLISNLATDSGSPLIGGGFGATYRLRPRLNLYTELGMQATTSEFYWHVAHTGMGVSTGFNCMFVWVVGLQYTFGVNTWRTAR